MTHSGGDDEVFDNVVFQLIVPLATTIQNNQVFISMQRIQEPLPTHRDILTTWKTSLDFSYHNQRATIGTAHKTHSKYHEER